MVKFNRRHFIYSLIYATGSLYNFLFPAVSEHQTAFITMAAAAVIGTVVTAGVAIYNGVKDRQAAERARKDQQKTLAQIQELHHQINAKAAEYQQSEQGRLDDLRWMNKNMTQQEAMRAEEFAAALRSSIDTYKLSAEQFTEAFVSSMSQSIQNGFADKMSVISQFSDAMASNITTFAVESGALKGATEAQFSAIRDQFRADTAATIQNYETQSTILSDEFKQQCTHALSQYDLEQSARNQNLQAVLSGATEEFKQAVNGQASVREKVVGDALENLGLELKNTNDGLAQVLGITPEENLDRARAAAQDFATEFLSQTGMQAGQMAQQQARMAGMTKGQAALMMTTAINDSINQNWQQAVSQGVQDYRTSEQIQSDRIAGQYENEQELQTKVMEEAKYAEQQEAKNAETAAKMEQDNAKYQAEMAQQDQQTKLQQQMDAAKQQKDLEQQQLSEATKMKEDAAKQEAEMANMDATKLADMSYDALKTKQAAEERTENTKLEQQTQAITDMQNQQQNMLQTQYDQQMNSAANTAAMEQQAAQAINEEKQQNEQAEYNRNIYEQETARAGEQYQIDQLNREADRLSGINTTQTAAATAANQQATDSANNAADKIGSGVSGVTGQTGKPTAGSTPALGPDRHE